MKGKTVEVAPFDSYTYSVVNRYTKERFGSFDSVLEAKEYAGRFHCDYWGDRFGDTYNLTKEERDSYLSYRIHIKYTTDKTSNRYLRRPFLIVNQYGDIIPRTVICNLGRKPYRNKSWENRCARREVIEKGLVKGKGNVNKIKNDWSYNESWDDWNQKVDYVNSAIRFYRRIGTHYERKWNEACNNEYGDGLIRRKRCGRNLPTSWDDMSSGMHRLYKSWKHNSKRCQQYKTK